MAHPLFRCSAIPLFRVLMNPPKEVNVMALTATATDATLASVKSRLAMKDVVIIGLRQDRSNIKLIVELYPDITVLCESLAKDLLDNRTKATKTVTGISHMIRSNGVQKSSWSGNP